MNWAAYQPGKRVVCLYDFAVVGAKAACTVLPIKGRVYTIRETTIGDGQTRKEILGLRFIEFQSFQRQGSPWTPADGEWWWEAERFRPVDETALDVFRQHLAPVLERARP